jgi:hypothetical protein
VQRRILQHYRLHPDKVVMVDGFFELPSLFEQIEMSLELGPTSETIRASNLKLGVGKGLGAAGIYQVLSLVFQVAKIGAIWEDARSVGWLIRHSELLSSKYPLSALRAERSFAKAQVLLKVGFYPFRGPDASFTLFQRTTTSTHRSIYGTGTVSFPNNERGPIVRRP